MGTVVDAVDSRLVFSKEYLKSLMDRFETLLWEVAACNASLVRDNDHGNLVPIEQGDGLCDGWQQYELLRLREVVDLFVDGSIAIQEDGLPEFWGLKRGQYSSFVPRGCCHTEILGWPGLEGFAETPRFLSLRLFGSGHPTTIFRPEIALGPVVVSVFQQLM